MKIISAVKLEKYVTNAGIIDIIIHKLYYKKKFYSIILFKVNKSLKISYYHATLPFSLAIYLKMESS